MLWERLQLWEYEIGSSRLMEYLMWIVVADDPSRPPYVKVEAEATGYAAVNAQDDDNAI